MDITVTLFFRKILTVTKWITSTFLFHINTFGQQLDTTFASIIIKTHDYGDNSSLDSVLVTLYPSQMEMVMVDTLFTKHTNSNCIAVFSHIPMLIDTLTISINEHESQAPYLINTASVMNTPSQVLNDIDAALINMYHQLGRNRYHYMVHDLPNLAHLRDSITLISAPVLN